MRSIGITGGVGAGKSEVMAYLQEQYDAAVILADDVGHSLMQKGNDCYDEIRMLFGDTVLDSRGELDRKVIAEHVFCKPELLQALNNIIHPAVKSHVLRTFELEEKAGRKFVFLEAALLVEEKYDEICDELWYIYAIEPVRRERLKASRHYSDALIDSILKRQLSDEVFRRHADVVIDNSGTPEDTRRQIEMRLNS